MANLPLSNLNGLIGFRVNGINSTDLNGGSVSSAGDVNGDGVDDILIGARGADPNGNQSAGQSYVVFGATAWNDATVDLAALDGSNGFRINGVDAFDESGISVSSAGDVNGDGVDDILIGARGADPNGNESAGESYVVFGSTAWSAASVNLATLDGSNGFRINGIGAGDQSGLSVSSAGDVNGDGVGDILIGAYNAEPNGNLRAGESYVVFGSNGWSAPSINLAALDGNNGFRIDGIDAEDLSGRSVSSAGDVNGDGVGDILIGALGADPNGNESAGESYVVFGSTAWSAASVNLATLDGSNGFRINGIGAGDQSGLSVSSAGDVNGDGVGDILIGAYNAEPNGNLRAGESYVVFGSNGWSAPSINLAALDGNNGFRIDGIDAGDHSGVSVSSAGDVNGDGIADILVGAYRADPNEADAGESYVVFGSIGWSAASISLAALDGSNGFRVDGIDIGDNSGVAVSSAGDVNGDGFDDILIGAPSADLGAGESYVVFGSASPGLNAPTGNVLISGEAVQNSTLIADASLVADADGLGALSYQWQRNGSDIIGATNIGHALTEADSGAEINVRVSYIDLWGNAESIASAVVNVNNFPTGDLLIIKNGAAIAVTDFISESIVLSADTSNLADKDGLGEFGYQWQRDGVDIAGGTAANYTLAQADVGSAISVVVSYTDGRGVLESVTSAKTGIVAKANNVPTGEVLITTDLASPVSATDTLSEDQTLRADASGLADQEGLGMFNYQWQRDGVDVAGATSVSYTLTQADVGAAMSVVVSYTDGQGASESISSAQTAAVVNMNDLPTGDVVITFTGSPVTGTDTILEEQTLTADASGLADGDGLGAFSYQWQRDGADITGATSANYTLTQADVGAAMSVVVSYTDGQGTEERVASAQTGLVGNINDAPTGGVVITGDRSLMGTVTADTSSLADEDGLGPLSYQWYADGVAIADATAVSLKLTEAQLGKTVTVDASYTDDFGMNEVVTSAPTAPVRPKFSPSVPVLTVGDVAPDGSVPLFVSYYLKEETSRVGAFTFSNQPNPVLNGGLTSSSGNVSPLQATTTVAITDMAGRDGRLFVWEATLTHNPGFVGDVEVSIPSGTFGYNYRYLVDAIFDFNSGGTRYVYDTRSATYTGTVTENVVFEGNAPIGDVIVVGDAVEDATLTANTSGLSDADGLGEFSYQWQRDGADVAGATSADYTLTQADVGSAISVVVSYTDGNGTSESVTSAQTGVVANVNDLPTGDAVITSNSVAITSADTVVEGQVLTVDTNSIADEDGLGAFAYQWQRNGVDIAGANSANYTLTQSDVGAEINVILFYTDGQGAVESVSSAATSAVINVNNDPTGAVIITGNLQEAAYLTADADNIGDLDGLGDFSYQWLSNGVEIIGANTNRYKLTEADVGTEVSVAVHYTDGFSTDEVITSSSTTPILNAEVWQLPAFLVLGAETGLNSTYTDATIEISVSDDANMLFSYNQNNKAEIQGGSSGLVISYNDIELINDEFTQSSAAIDWNIQRASSDQLSVDYIYWDLQYFSGDAGFDKAVFFFLNQSEQFLINNGAELANELLNTVSLVEPIPIATEFPNGADLVEMVPVSNATPTGIVNIGGVLRQGENITAETSNLEDANGLGTLSYQWRADGTPISGATSDTYTLTQAEVGKAITVTVSYTDGGGTNELVTSAATGPVTPPVSAITTAVTHRFGQAMSDPEVTTTEIIAGNEVFLREVSSTDAGTVFELVAAPTANISTLDFEFTDNVDLISFQLGTALAGWTIQSNTAVANTVTVSGFGALDGSQDIVAGIETILATFETVASPNVDVTGIFTNGVAQQDISLRDVPATSKLANVTVHEVANGADAFVFADMDVDLASENAVGSFDALQALRLAVGLNKSDGTAEWHDYFAADINKDGRVGADDALNILKYAVGLTDGPAADWVFVDSKANYLPVTRQNSGYEEGVLLGDVVADATVEFTAILVGDVDGSYIL